MKYRLITERVYGTDKFIVATIFTGFLMTCLIELLGCAICCEIKRKTLMRLSFERSTRKLRSKPIGCVQTQLSEVSRPNGGQETLPNRHQLILNTPMLFLRPETLDQTRGHTYNGARKNDPTRVCSLLNPNRSERIANSVERGLCEATVAESLGRKTSLNRYQPVLNAPKRF